MRQGRALRPSAEYLMPNGKIAAPTRGDSREPFVAMDGHVMPDVLIRLVNGELPAESAPEVFGHLAFCEECRTRVHALRAIAKDPGAAWERMAAIGVDAPAGGAAPSRSFRAMVHVVVDAARNMASVTLENIGDAITNADLFTAMPASGGILVGNAAPLGRVDADEPRVEMRLESVEFGTATVVADARRHAIAVLLKPLAGADARQHLLDRRPRAVLIDDGGCRRHEANFEPVEGATYLLAEFEHPEGTTWDLGLEFED
jgi:hypothetical protein